MDLESALSKLRNAEEGIKSQGPKIENNLRSIFDKLERYGLNKSSFKIEIDKGEYFIDIDLGYEDIDVKEARRLIKTGEKKSPKYLKVNIKGNFYFSPLKIKTEKVWEYEKVGIIKRKKIIRGVKEIKIEYDSNMSSERFYKFLVAGYRSHAKKALEIASIILILRNLEKYFAMHLELISQAHKIIGEEVDITTIKIPPMMKKCEGCGSPNPDLDLTCVYCGSSLIMK